MPMFRYAMAIGPQKKRSGEFFRLSDAVGIIFLAILSEPVAWPTDCVKFAQFSDFVCNFYTL